MNFTHIIVRDFRLPALIGIYPKEHTDWQEIVVDVTMILKSPIIPHDIIDETVSYEGVVGEIRRLAATHHNLVETVAEILANYCLRDPRVASTEISIRKTQVYHEGAVGCIIRRENR